MMISRVSRDNGAEETYRARAEDIGRQCLELAHVARNIVVNAIHRARHPQRRQLRVLHTIGRRPQRQ